MVMTNITSSIRESARLIAPMLRHEPGIGVNLKAADMTVALAVIYNLIGKGIRGEEAIADYLIDREFSYDRDAIRFLLNTYDGRDARHSLWVRDKTGSYSLLN